MPKVEVTLFRFDFDETFKIRSMVVPSDSFTHALSKVAIFFGGEACLSNIVSIHKVL